MRNWKFWDWVAYACLGVAAIGMAVGQVLKENQTVFETLPTFLLGPKWAYAPIILFALGSAILAVRVVVPLVRTPPASERVFVEEAPEELLALGKDLTSLQRDKITEIYIGKWLRVSNPVRNVTSYRHGAIVTVNIGNTQQQIELLFNAQWFDRVSLLMVGRNVTAIGQIQKIYRTSIELKNCELMDSSSENVPIN
jgi:hypothetical protein